MGRPALDRTPGFYFKYFMAVNIVQWDPTSPWDASPSAPDLRAKPEAPRASIPVKGLRMRIPTTAALALLAAACAPSPQDAHGANAAPSPPSAVPAGPTPAATPGEGEARVDTSRIARLEREARALAHAEGCTAGACRTAPVGSRPCGGPRTYLVYCAATTDSAALFAKLAELARAEAAFNRASGMASTCEFREPPNLSVQGGRCVATAAKGLVQ
jgi:hypothetical protein